MVFLKEHTYFIFHFEYILNKKTSILYYQTVFTKLILIHQHQFISSGIHIKDLMMQYVFISMLVC